MNHILVGPEIHATKGEGYGGGRTDLIQCRIEGQRGTILWTLKFGKGSGP